MSTHRRPRSLRSVPSHPFVGVIDEMDINMLHSRHELLQQVSSALREVFKHGKVQHGDNVSPVEISAEAGTLTVVLRNEHSHFSGEWLSIQLEELFHVGWAGKNPQNKDEYLIFIAP